MTHHARPFSQNRPFLEGVGLGLRTVHYDHVLSHRPAVPFFEVISENYMGPRGGSGGRPLNILRRLRPDYPLSLHGVSMNIGSVDPLDMDYLKRLKLLIQEIDPLSVSDHLCWTGVGGENLHDLLPLPYTEEALSHVAARVAQVQDYLGRQILIENVSSYVAYQASSLTEWEFLTALSEKADCGLLFDVNNIYVSAKNHGYHPLDFLNGVPVERVGEMHLAGYSDEGDLLVDTHDHPVSEPVWNLYAAAVDRFGPVPTVIEWDDRIPPFEELAAEASKARTLQLAALPR
jgi:uncharacterized protein (UPF0276 family)